MKKLLMIFIVLFPISLSAQFTSEPRFTVERFNTAQEAVDYANKEVEIVHRPHVQFITEFDARSTSPASYVVIVDNHFRDNNNYAIETIVEWKVRERMSLPEAVDMINDKEKLFPEEIQVLPYFVGYWNPYIHAYSTTISTFYIPIHSPYSIKCEYSIVNKDLGAPSAAMEYLQDGLSTTIERVKFVNQFNVGYSVFGSLWLVKGDCTRPSSIPMHWKLVEVDDQGNTFDVESAIKFVEDKEYNYVRFVSFTSPSQHDSRSRVLIFHHN